MEMKKLKYRLILPLIQCCLVIAAFVTNKSMHNGSGEGMNQIIANILTNIEFYLKTLFGYDDIVNYHFRFVTTFLGILIWLFLGYLLDVMMQPKHKLKLNPSKE